MGRDYSAIEVQLADPHYKIDPLTRAEAQSCLSQAKDESKRSQADRFLDMGLIVAAAVFAGGGTAATTASGFMSPNADARPWAAGVGAVAIGIGSGLLALRTALNLGEISNARLAVAATQAGLATKIASAPDPVSREPIFAVCAQTITQPNSSYPSEAPAPRPVLSADAGAD